MRNSKGQFIKGIRSNPNGEFKKGLNPWNKGLNLPIFSEMQKRGEDNPAWKGNKVSFRVLHKWVRRNKLKPEFCEECKLVPPLDVANISQKYLRDINDFEWLCRRCHMIKDGRIKNLLSYKYT